MSEDSRPNWRDASVYPDSDISPHLKAWEFLRRNEDYRQEYEYWVTLPDETRDGNISGKWKGVPGGNLTGFYCDPPAASNEDFTVYRNRLENSGVFSWDVWPYADYICERFRFGPQPINPNLSAIELLEANSLFVYFAPKRLTPFLIDFDDIIRFEMAQSSIDPESDSYLVAAFFDLRFPIDPQTKRAQLLLSDKVKEFEGLQILRKIHTRAPPDDNFVLFLRLLDAADAGASNDELVEVFAPNKENSIITDYKPRKRLKNQLQTARKLRDGDYTRFVESSAPLDQY